MNELQTFPVQQFYEALMSSTGLQEKLDIILKQIKTKNTQTTYQAVVHIHQILNSKLQPPLMKFNALNCAKIFFDTCEYSVILLIEVYLLPIIFQIAAFKATKKSQQGLSLYFIERGAQPTKQVKRLGFNYVSLAIEFIYATSQVKMYRILENQELEQESNFKKIAKALKMRGVAQITSFKFYNNFYIEQTRKIFVDKLQIFNPQGFIDFINDLIFGELTDGKHLDLDSKRLIMFGDVYVISPLVNRIQEQLNQIDGNFQGKRKILTLLFQLVRFGFAEAILLLNTSEFLTNIASQISKVQGDKDMDQGRWIYQQIDDNQKSKKLFYLQFLKCIQSWSYAIPLNQHNQGSDAKRLFEYLKFQKKFKFPENQNLHKYKSQMQIYLRQNTERNQKVISLINRKQDSDAKSSTKSRYKISSLKDESNIKTKQMKTMQFEELQDIVINTMRILQVVGFQEKRFDKQMKRLLKFKQNWHTNLEIVKKKITEEQEPYNLDMLISEGEIVYQQVVGLQKIYLQFKESKIKFQQAQQKITVLLNQLDEDNHISEVSVSAKSKNTRLTNRRDLKSKISQRARDRSLSDHSKNSYVSQSKSAKSNLKMTKNNQNKPLITKKNQQEQIPKIYNPINETFAFNQPQPRLSTQNKKISNNDKIQKEHKKPVQNIQKENSKFLIQKINDYGIQQQMIRKNNQPSTATFIAVKNSNISMQFEDKIQNNTNSKNNLVQKDIRQPKEKKLQKFEDSFEIQSPFKKKNQKQTKEGSRINKRQQFSKVLFTSDDESPSPNIINTSNNKSNTKIRNQKQVKIQFRQKKQSLIKKALSSDKISFQKNLSSDSQQQFTSAKVQNNPSNNKISKFTSFNNGNVSAYFNEQSIEEYGFSGNIKQSIKYDHKTKQNLNLSSNIIDPNQIKTNQKIKLINFDNQKVNKSSQKSSVKLNSSKQISQIKVVQIQSVGNFDDFQLVNGKKESNESSNSKKSRSYLKDQLNNSRKKELNESQYSDVYKVDLTQKIKEQESFQMIESHYKTKQVEQRKLKDSSQNKEMKFGEIVEVKKQIIHTRDGVLSPFNHEQTDGRKNRMKKLIQLQNMNLKNSSKRNMMMQVLSERSAKKGIQDYLIQKQKNKLIKNLNIRIKKLQNEQQTIQTKLSKKDEQLRSISYKNYSQKQRMKFKSQNISQGSIQNSLRQNDLSNTSIYYRINNQNKDTNKINEFLISGQTRMSGQNIIDLGIYDKFVNKIDDNSLKKNCLRNKSLIIVNEQMQIGCMSIKKDKFINFTLFITPKQLTMKNVKLQIQQNQNLSIGLFPQFLYTIKAKKQQTINIKIMIQNVPFQIPKINLQYQLQTNNITSKSNYLSSISIIIPCTFNKLCSFSSLNIGDFYNMFNSGQFKNDIKTCHKFKLNSKIFKQQKIKQFFPFLTLLKKIDDINNKSKTVYGFQTNYNGNVFLVLLKVQDKKYAKIQIKNMTGQHKTQKYVQFFMATFKKLISS